METNPDFRKNLTAKEVADIFRYELSQTQRPANEIILDDVDLMKLLKVSKRTTAGLREKKIINYYKVGGKIFYKLSDVLALIEKNKVTSTNDTLRIKI